MSRGPEGGWAAVTALLDGALAERIGSAAEIVVRSRGEEVFRYLAGEARREPTPRPLVDPPLWDLASVTKALAGATVAWALIDAGVLRFGDPARRFVPEIPEGVSVAMLLSHSSGYPPWRPLYEEIADAQGLPWGAPETRAAIIRAAIGTPLQSPPGEAHAYTDLGFLALLAVLEAAGGDRLDRLWAELVAGPLGLTGLRWCPGPGPAVVATEDCPRRGRVVEGEVHDLNCAAMGGVSSHAGLFGEGRAAAAAGQVLMERFLAGGSAAQRWGWSRRGAGSHALGWDGISHPSSTGRSFPADAVGHLGFTGTSLWAVPSQRVVVTLLTNRVHPRLDDRIRALRPAVHDAVVAALAAGGRWSGEPLADPARSG
jgi:CubicO group peptidase (beta-lactamase class C family)